MQNSGNVFGDGATVSGGVVAGANARIRIENRSAAAASDLDELDARIDDLVALLRDAVDRGQVSAEALGAGTAVKEQAAAPAPNKLTITSLLGGIATAAGSVRGVAEAVEVVRALVTKLF